MCPIATGSSSTSSPHARDLVQLRQGSNRCDAIGIGKVQGHDRPRTEASAKLDCRPRRQRCLFGRKIQSLNRVYCDATTVLVAGASAAHALTWNALPI